MNIIIASQGDELSTYSNLLAYLGFNIVAYAFLSQYLSFSKDLLSELNRMRRPSPQHEMPLLVPETAKAGLIENSTSPQQEVERIKTFFLENDLLTFNTLFYLVFSIAIIIALLLKKCGLGNSICFRLLIILSILFGVVLTLGLWRELIREFRQHAGRRRWPGLRGNRTAKIFYHLYLWLIGAACVILIIFHCANNDRVFLILVSGLLFYLLIYLFPLYFRMPVSRLLGLWERLER